MKHAPHELERHRHELKGYCRRFLRSSVDAEDAAQETLVRAWRGLDGFDGRAALRSWLYRIATNVCFDMLRGAQRSAVPADLSPSSPFAETHASVTVDDPAERVAVQESVKLAFVTALHELPPRQRAVLILRDVLRWSAEEVAELLGSTTASVNSLLQRARTTLIARNIEIAGRDEPMDGSDRDLLHRYVDAFERYDVESLIAVARDDATFSRSLLAAS